MTMTRIHILPTCPRDEWNRAYHGARIGIQHPPMVRPAGVPRRTWRLAVAAVLWRWYREGAPTSLQHRLDMARLERDEQTGEVFGDMYNGYY